MITPTARFTALVIAVGVALSASLGDALAAPTETVISSFLGGSDGATPYAGLVMDKTGALYGTTAYGGTPDDIDTVFKLTPPARGQTAWSETVLHSFDYGVSGSNDGANPYASLVMDSSGALYGATVLGGGSPSSLGTVFKLTPPGRGQTAWTEAVLYSFMGPASDGAHPSANLVKDKSGALYSTTAEGGTDDLGTVFKLMP